jgi:hypothetical protein
VASVVLIVDPNASMTVIVPPGATPVSSVAPLGSS